MRVVLATANPDKAREIRQVLEAADLELLERPASIPEVDETGTTLEHNAILKADALARATGLPAIADDTGLFVDALDGAPGVYSARYAGEHATYADNVAKLLDALAATPSPRRARFETCAVLQWPDGRALVATGTVDGEIIDVPRGTNGFGYDPVFVPTGDDRRTLAERSDAEKGEISHRGRAFRALADQLAGERRG